MRLYGGMVSSLLIRQRRRRHWRLRHNPVFFLFLFIYLFLYAAVRVNIKTATMKADEKLEPY